MDIYIYNRATRVPNTALSSAGPSSGDPSICFCQEVVKGCKSGAQRIQTRTNRAPTSATMRQGRSNKPTHPPWKHMDRNFFKTDIYRSKLIVQWIDVGNRIGTEQVLSKHGTKANTPNHHHNCQNR